MDIMDQQLVQAEMRYRLERGRGPRTDWARTEGRQDPVVRRGWLHRRTTTTTAP